MGWTSHDVVARVRRLAQEKRVGHAGTLDPLATGVLPVLLGRATRLMDFIQSGRKTYIATVKLGEATETDDAEGEIISRSAVPVFTDFLLQNILDRFRGEILQRPPNYSALKIAGQTAYTLARRGDEVALAERPITIHHLRLLSWSENELELEVTCSKGTYIRALARDIASDLGTVGHLSSLVRTCVGPFHIADAITLDELTDRGVAASTLAPTLAVADATTFFADSDKAQRLRNGQPIAQLEFLMTSWVWVYDPEDQLVCLARAEDGQLKPRIAL